jgi:hypothetical protein
MAGTIQYVVVVHGMGEARQNETILAVASRFAEARSGKFPWPPPSITVPLGSAMGQTGIQRDIDKKADGLPWVEFDGIPADRYPSSNIPFYGQPSTSGDNLRFVDIHWNDLLARDWPFVGQPPNIWVDGLLGRLIRKDRDGTARVPQWILEILRTLGETISLVHNITALRAKDLDDVVFNKYLGDVQLYGEFPETRGLAVRRFHERMQAVVDRHRQTNPNNKMEFTVIAHSLGTIMAADALMLARSNIQGCLRGTNPGISEAIRGYFSQRETDVFLAVDKDLREGKVPDAEKLKVYKSLTEVSAAGWIEHVKDFVTLGSPIDKFLIIWWLNYAYLRDSALLAPDLPRIPHYNYCEEQDPVGHHLDVAYTAPVFASVFEEMEDRVYTRYAIPGLAHTHYWEDLPLFNWILAQTIDKRVAAGTPPRIAKEPVWFVPGVYWWIVTINYLIVPLAVAVAHMIAMNWAWNADGVNGMVLGAGMFAITWLLGRYILDLFIWWRQVLKVKAKMTEGAPSPASVKQPGSTQIAHLTQSEEGTRIPDQPASVEDIGSAAFGATSLPGWLYRWCRSPKQPEEGMEPPKDERQRWKEEYAQRTQVESQLRGVLAIIHWTSLVLLAAAVAWYWWSFANWKDVARMFVLGLTAGALILAWVIAVHGEVAGWQMGRRPGGFRSLCAKRIGPRDESEDSDEDRLKTEGFFDCDFPGALRMAVASVIGILTGIVLHHAVAHDFLKRYEPACAGLLWASAGLAGAIGYTRTRISRVKELLKFDDNSKPIDFNTYFPPGGGIEPPRPKSPPISPAESVETADENYETEKPARREPPDEPPMLMA